MAAEQSPAAKRQKLSDFDVGHVDEAAQAAFVPPPGAAGSTRAPKDPKQAALLLVSPQKEQILLDYLKKNRRPLNIPAIVENLQGALSKKDAEALLSVSEAVAKFVRKREIGKSVAILYAESEEGVSLEEKKAFLEGYSEYDLEVLMAAGGGGGGMFEKTLASKLAEAKEKTLKLNAQVKMEKAKEANAKKQKELAEQGAKAAKENKELVATQQQLSDRAKLSKECQWDPAPFWKVTNKWRQRKKVCLEMADAVLGESGTSRAQFLVDSIGAEMDKEELGEAEYKWCVEVLKVPRD
mmetsp:Transcript_17282/g.42953  ORF Transcript_17282/g.42953 Transcript_17282/m.42953 type:complete len:296 (+) Transcript_17282:440-1327(+)|eukprot:CAMPEP_0178995438 /NCGR_PEP_ID=MMETSP0795-20121207/7828_1 /TAXON_ID=88552 /ORGANISM="Amoebophrya sp., Strain Ameob2" /LENGTH=295 /DNA_ID=CAMNT_0020687747 /DNA_START=338 /DNA_END=1225 /DNA_ORIENTATION=+